VDAEDVSALRAPPSVRLMLNEYPDTITLDSSEVFDHTEAVLRSIAQVHAAQPCAGERVALKAETP